MDISGLFALFGKAAAAIGAMLKGEPKARADDGSGIAVVSGFRNKTEVSVTNNYGAPSAAAPPPKWRIEERGFTSTEREYRFVLRNVGGSATSVEITCDIDGPIMECGSIGSDGERYFSVKWLGRPFPTTLHWRISWCDRAGAPGHCGITGLRTTTKWMFTISP